MGQRPIALWGEMDEARPVGVIKGIGGCWYRERELFVFTDRLVLVPGTLWDTWAPIIAMNFGALGVLILSLGAESRTAKREARLRAGPDHLLAADPKGVQFMSHDVVDARLSPGFFESKITLSMADGSTHRFDWVKSANKIDEVRGFLRAALGTRLIDQSKAA